MKRDARPVMAMVAMAALAAAWSGAEAQQPATQPVGVVAHVKVLSDKVQDVSSLEAWKKSFIKDGMTDQEKALAVWKSSVMFVYQDNPPNEYLHEGCAHDAIKMMNVYGYGMCCCAASRVCQLSRAVGLEARAWGNPGHSLPEVKWDGEWHMLDASLVNYFTKPDGKIAGMAEICQAVNDWFKDHEDLRNQDSKIRKFHAADDWSGWMKGPELLKTCKFYDRAGMWPARTHGWYSTMQEYGGNAPFPFEYGYSQGYEVNIQLRPGEKLTRNWFNKGITVNSAANGKMDWNPGCIDPPNRGHAMFMEFTKNYGDLTKVRVGCGTQEYDVPLADKTLPATALKWENLAVSDAGALKAADAGKPGVLELRMPTSYVYLNGKLSFTSSVGESGKIGVLLSDNNGLDWKDVATVEESGKQGIDLQKFVHRRYDYRLRFVLNGKDAALKALKISHDIQCSQRALPTLTQGENTITFSAGPQESSVSIEGTAYPEMKKSGQLILTDYHPTLNNIHEQYFRVKSAGVEGATVTFPISTPAEMTRLQMGGHYRLRDKNDKWEMQVSFDGGKTFKTVDTQAGPYQGICKYVTVSDIPAGTKDAQVRWLGAERNTTCLFMGRITADYKLPASGFRPVKVTYVWEEGGVEKKDVHVAKSPEETYKITCAGKPVMKSIILELDQ